jgi:hypothetical protein
MYFYGEQFLSPPPNPQAEGPLLVNGLSLLTKIFTGQIHIQGVKLTTHPLRSRAEVKNAWSYTSIPPIYLPGMVLNYQMDMFAWFGT